MRRSTSADNRMEGVGACAVEVNVVKKIKAMTEQSFRIDFSFGSIVKSL